MANEYRNVHVDNTTGKHYIALRVEYYLSKEHFEQAVAYAISKEPLRVFTKPSEIFKVTKKYFSLYPPYQPTSLTDKVISDNDKEVLFYRLNARHYIQTLIPEILEENEKSKSTKI